MKIQQTFAVIVTLATVLSFTACGSESKDDPAALAVGDAYGGGIVAYILEPGDPGYDPDVQHGLIAAAADQSTGIIWAIAAFESTAVPGGTETALGTGSANTDNIIAQNGAGTTYAAGVARAYNGDGHTDWYLPSRDELNKLYLNRTAIGGFGSQSYWTSSENSASLAERQNLVDGMQFANQKNITTGRVRAVRSF